MQIDDLVHLLDGQRREHDDLIDAVEEFRPESGLERFLDFFVLDAVLIGACVLQETQRAALAYELGAKVAGHDQHRVAEVHHLALSIGQTTVIQDLQQRVPDFRMRLFDFVEQDHPVWAAADGFGQLTTFLVAHITWRSAEQARDRMLFAIFAHIQANQSFLVTEHEFSQCFGQLGLADARRPDEDERTNRAARVF